MLIAKTQLASMSQKHQIIKKKPDKIKNEVSCVHELNKV